VWVTKSENNNDYFVVQRSSDGANFEDLKNIDAAGNSNEEISYSWLDENPLSGLSYYRLKQVDFDGAISFSEIETVDFTDENDFVIYPNPVSSGQSLYFTLPMETATESTVTIYDVTGKIVMVQRMNNNTVMVDLSSGMYRVKVMSDGLTFEKNLIITQ
ncbi:MAG: T9SS type A sorting domain-containing protein, partial [Crocinitomicaceae bacterium]|nr:T9SS type A sorting domain-containing protein [Crocinitomicaceae bacterium]